MCVCVCARARVRALYAQMHTHTHTYIRLCVSVSVVCLSCRLAWWGCKNICGGGVRIYVCVEYVFVCGYDM